MTYSWNKSSQAALAVLAISLFAQSHSANAEEPVTECENIAPLSNKSYKEIKDHIKERNKKSLQDWKESAEKCAKTTAPTQGQSKVIAENILTAMKEISVEENSLEGFNFAVGLGLVYLKADDVKAATIDNGIVRVTDAEKTKLGVWLTTSTFFSNVNILVSKSDKYRWGMFVAAQIGEEKIVNSVATGLSLASSQPGNSSSGSAPLVFQLGYGWTRIQTLADGYVDGQALPSGATQPLFKKATSGGPVLLVSYNFN